VVHGGPRCMASSHGAHCHGDVHGRPVVPGSANGLCPWRFTYITPEFECPVTTPLLPSRRRRAKQVSSQKPPGEEQDGPTTKRKSYLALVGSLGLGV